MKLIRLLLCMSVVVVCLTPASAPAIPVGDSNDAGDYSFGASDLSHWVVGAFTEKRDRKITHGFFTDESMTTDNQMLYIGYDLKPDSPLNSRRPYGVIPYVIGGRSRTQFGSSSDSSSETAYGLGVHFNILDHEIEEAFLSEDRIRLNGNLQYGWFTATWAGTNTKWTELFGSLTASIVNDIEGDKAFLPDAIAIYFGPIFSDLSGASLDENKKFGYTAGLEIYTGNKVSLNFGFDKIENSAFRAGIQIKL